jgi:YfiH family protein
VTILTSALLAKSGVVHAFPTRATSDAALLDALGALDCHAVLQIKQVHGARAVRAEDVAGASGLEGDAIVARAGPAGRGVAVGVRVADCVPVLVADRASGSVAAIHAGWRGVVGGVIRAGVELLEEGEVVERLARGEVVAAIGPCIGACCFEVGRDVAAQIGFVVRREGDKAYVDLRAAVRSQLRALGLPDACIDDVPGCTRHEPERFHSYRRDGAHSGRMLAAVVSRSAPA